MRDQPRHPVTGRFLAFDCEIDCQKHCAGLCLETMIDECINLGYIEVVAEPDDRIV